MVYVIQCKSQNTCNKYSTSCCQLLSLNPTAHTSYCRNSNKNVSDSNTGQMEIAVSTANMETDNTTFCVMVLNMANVALSND